MSHRYTVIFEKEEEGGYHVFCPTLPGCHTQSETIEEGVENIREAIGSTLRAWWKTACQFQRKTS